MEKKCIIVIEDQEDLAALYKATLKKAGYKVTNAYTGEEGVAEFQAGGADAIVMDMTLPEMHGLKALREIRAIAPSVPVIVVTGETSDETRSECERLGVQGYLSKPVEYDTLLEVLANAFGAATDEEYELVTIRLPKRVVAALTELDSNLGKAVTKLYDDNAGAKGAAA